MAYEKEEEKQVEGKKKKKVSFRFNYVSYTSEVLDKFLNWVNSFGFEKSFLGRIAFYLDQRFHLRHAIFFFIYCLILTFLIFYDFELLPRLNVGDVAVNDVKSPFSFTLVDEVATETKKVEAEENVPPVFDYDQDIYEKIFNQVYASFRQMRKEVNDVKWPKSPSKRSEKIKEFLSLEEVKFEKSIGRNVSTRVFEWLVERQFSVHVENALILTLGQWSERKIYEISENILPNKFSKLILREVRSQKEEALSRDQLYDLRDKKNFQLSKNIKRRFSKISSKKLLSLSRVLLIPNVTVNRNETEERKLKARQSVLPIQLSIEKNQTIVSAGAVIQPIHIAIFNEIEKSKADRNFGVICLAFAFLFTALLLGFSSYLRRFTKVSFMKKDIFVMAALVVLSILFLKTFWFLMEATFLDKYGGTLPTTLFLYAAPVAFAPFLLGFLIMSGELVWLFTCFISFIFCLMAESNFQFLIYTFLSGLVALRYIHNCKRRSNVYGAGLKVGLVNAFIIVIFVILNHWNSVNFYNELLWNVPMGFISGISSSLLAMMLLPFFESVFNYTTDLKLLELSNLSHPLMQKLMVKAPGTYHHSLVVGSMVEAAAERIGCNPLLSKVMAYYHDIGKADYAEYFIENQRPNDNPHDEISPYMSRTIIIAHVKDGAEIGLEYNLGKPIVDGILQHHGTTLISYFYNKALGEEGEGHTLVNEEDFRYPGPKPQFREAALVMLADSIEAAARSLAEPTVTRLQNIVKSIIKSKFLDAQLDECDLTLADLSIIEDSFEHILLGIYHQRVEYPGKNLGLKTLTRPSNKGPYTA